MGSLLALTEPRVFTQRHVDPPSRGLYLVIVLLTANAGEWTALELEEIARAINPKIEIRREAPTSKTFLARLERLGWMESRWPAFVRRGVKADVCIAFLGLQVSPRLAERSTEVDRRLPSPLRNGPTPAQSKVHPRAGRQGTRVFGRVLVGRRRTAMAS